MQISARPRRAVGVCHNVLTDRAQQHSGKAISATGPDNNQVGPLRPLDQYLRGVSLLDRGLELNRRRSGLEVSD